MLAYDSQIFTAAEYFYEWDPIIFREMNNNKDAYGNGESSFIKKEDFYNDIKRIDENTVIKFLVKFEFAGIGKIVEFKRTKKNFLEVIANICSLFLSLHSLFGILLTYYARRFNNYQILKKVINLKNTKEDNQILINYNSKENKTNEVNDNLEFPLINNISNKKDSESNINVINNDKEQKINAIEDNINLPNFSFFDFYLNNFYCKICKKSKKQEIMNIANEIAFKYLSIDFVVANLIKLENLWKDYKWNNPSLNSVENNDLV